VGERSCDRKKPGDRRIEAGFLMYKGGPLCCWLRTPLYKNLMDGHGKRNQSSWKKVQLLAAPRNFQKHLQPHINNKVNFLKKSTCHRCSTCAHVMDVAHSALWVVGNRITQTSLKRNAWKTLCLRKFEFGELATFCIPDPSTTFGFNQHTHTRCSSPTCRLSAEEHWSGCG
jgi:hypothetical protein